jgi:nitrogen regulatory protein P-II 1
MKIMKEIKAIVKPFKVNDILNQLLEAGYPNLTVSMAEGTGNFKDTESSISTHFSITDSKVAKIEIVCNDTDVNKIIEIISQKGRTGLPGDGIIYVSDVEKAIRVKTGKEDDRNQFNNGF